MDSLPKKTKYNIGRHNKKIAILSVKYDRATFEALNFNHIDPSDALTNFSHHMKFKKTKGFEEISQFVN